MSLQGKVALVTGSTSGIGLGIARTLAAAGTDLMLNGFGDAGQIEALRAEIAATYGVRVAYSGADISKPDQIAAMVETTQGTLGSLDILVNNAGIQHVAPVDEFPIDKWDAVIAINLTSAFHTCRAAIPIMKAQGRGRIVNIASAHGLVASPFKAAYVAAKHGAVGLTKTLGVELARTGITANAICPGYVKTPLVEKQIGDQAAARGIAPERVVEDVILAAQPNRRFVEYDHLAGMLLYLASDMGASSTGASMVVDGGWTAG
jgi:3-hydroxybutyrate dehydrogenase